MISIKINKNTVFKITKFELFSWFIKFIITLFLMFIVGFYYGKDKYELKNREIKTKTITVYETVPDKEFSPENLRSYLFELNIRFPHIVYAQAVLETANFNSKIFKENNNLFGMKYAIYRPKTSKGIRRGHSYYNNWQESVIDYALFQAAYLNHLRTEKEYLNYLDMRYAEDPNYIQKIKHIISKDNLAIVFKN